MAIQGAGLPSASRPHSSRTSSCLVKTRSGGVARRAKIELVRAELDLGVADPDTAGGAVEEDVADAHRLRR